MTKTKQTNWNSVASKKTVEKTIEALKANGINAYFAENAAQAKSKALELIPKGSEVMTMTSVT
ncbi:MAG TPA: LUD domain-containing protein, partial [Candidatus Nanoarchaeia archaeon]|nr:LUD domain-containing protein [Candidatus Nanoarchaeia archaeon]